MKHKIIRKVGEVHPYEVIHVELITEKDEELSHELNYLQLNLEAVDIIDSDSPRYTIKVPKKNLGIGT